MQHDLCSLTRQNSFQEKNLQSSQACLASTHVGPGLILHAEFGSLKDDIVFNPSETLDGYLRRPVSTNGNKSDITSHSYI